MLTLTLLNFLFFLAWVLWWGGGVSDKEPPCIVGVKLKHATFI